MIYIERVLKYYFVTIAFMYFEKGFTALTNFAAVETLLPHRSPAIVVDKLDSIENNTAVCSRTVRKNEHYGPGLCEEGIIEFCAQSAICGQSLNAGGQEKIGVIAGIDDFCFYKKAISGDVLVAKIVTQAKMGNLSLFECTVRCGSDTIAHGFIKAALT